MIYSVHIPNVETRGYMRSPSLRTNCKEMRLLLVLETWGPQLISQLHGFHTTSKSNSPYFLTNAYSCRTLMNLPQVCPSCDLWLATFKLFPISIFKSRHKSRPEPSFSLLKQKVCFSHTQNYWVIIIYRQQ